MNEKKILQSMNYIGDDLIEASAKPHKTAKRTWYIPAYISAAAVCLIITVAIYNLNTPINKTNPNGELTNYFSPSDEHHDNPVTTPTNTTSDDINVTTPTSTTSDNISATTTIIEDKTRLPIDTFTKTELTLAEARADINFGAYMPQVIPNNFIKETIYRYTDEYNDYLSGLWYKNYDEFRWRIRYFEDEDYSRVTSVEDTRNYDLSFYPIPRADSVPEELREIVDNPIFDISELTLEAVCARAYSINDSGDTNGLRMHFSVLCGDIIVEVSCKGVNPEWLYSQLNALKCLTCFVSVI